MVAIKRSNGDRVACFGVPLANSAFRRPTYTLVARFALDVIGISWQRGDITWDEAVELAETIKQASAIERSRLPW